MRISVIIPTLNEAASIAQLVLFAFQHSKGHVAEVIVVDAGSTDGTVSLAKEAGAQTLANAPRSRAMQMNEGARHATGDILYFIHADVKLVSSFVEDILCAISEGFDAGCYRFKFDSPKVMLRINSYCTRFHGIMSRGGDQTLFITRTLFIQLDGFDEYYSIMEDFDLIKRIWKHGKFKVIPKSVVVSARKYEQNSWLRVQLANLTVFMMFFLKRNPEQMKLAYKKMLDYR